MHRHIVSVIYVVTICLALAGMFLLVRSEQFTEIDGRLIMNTPQSSSTPSKMEIFGVVAENPINYNSIALVRVDVYSTVFSPISIDKTIFVKLDALALQLKKGDRIKLYCDTKGLTKSPKEFGYCGWDNFTLK